MKAGLHRKSMKPEKTNLWRHSKGAEGVSGYIAYVILFFYFRKIRKVYYEKQLAQMEERPIERYG